MTKTTPRARYTLEFKQEAVRLVEGGQSIAAAARTLGVVDQTLFNWIKAHRAGRHASEHSGTSAPPGNGPSTGSLGKRPTSSCVATGAAPARDAQ